MAYSEKPLLTKLLDSNGMAGLDLPLGEKSTSSSDALARASPKTRSEHFLPAPAELFYSRGGTGTYVGSVANLVNTGVGAGMLTLPFAYQNSGVVLGTAMLIFFALLVSYSLHQIGRCQKSSDSKSYQEVVKKVLGDRAEKACIYSQLFFFTGICVGFLDIIPDQLQPALKSWAGEEAVMAKREFIIIIVAVFILFPMMFIRNIQKLSPVATFSVCGSFYTVGLFVYEAAFAVHLHDIPEFVFGEPKPNIGAQVSTVRASINIFKTIPLYCSAYFVHTTYPLVFYEMRKKKLSRTITSMDSATMVSMFLCFIIYMLIGFAGLCYAVIERVDSGHELGVVPGDALQMFPNTPRAVIARFSISISVIASYITLHFTSSKCLEDLLVSGQQGGFTARQRLIEVVVFLACTVGASMVIKDLDLVLGVMGSLTVVPFMFIVPGLLQAEYDKDNEVGWRSKNTKYKGYFLVVLGLLLSISGLVVTLAGAR